MGTEMIAFEDHDNRTTRRLALTAEGEIYLVVLMKPTSSPTTIAGPIGRRCGLAISARRARIGGRCPMPTNFGQLLLQLRTRRDAEALGLGARRVSWLGQRRFIVSVGASRTVALVR
jgi:hypothetical protein